MSVPIDTNISGDAGWLTNGVALRPVNTGAECLSIDTQLPGGQQPQTAALNLQSLADALLFLQNQASKTPTAGSIYYRQVNINTPVTLTGVSVLLAGTGGTDNWVVGLYNSAGALVASSAATLAGTANTWQQIPFAATYAPPAGVYYIALQSNGTTALFETYNAPTFPLVTGSQTGSAPTLAAITPPTTYTANLGPVTQLY